MNRLVPALVVLSLTGCVRVSRHAHSGSNSTTHSTIGHRHVAANWPDADRLTLTYRADGRSAILESDRVTLIFPNLSTAELSSFSFQQGALNIQVGGPGVSETTVNCRRNEIASTFRSRYENGTNTIQFFDRNVKLANHGRLIINGSHVIDTAAKQSVLIQ